jgi:DNA repair photolyase
MASTNSADPFAQIIQIKINAAEVLDRELDQVPPDVIIAGDYPPIDSRYRISRQMLQVCLDHSFPTMIIAKSPAVLHDLDLIRKISERSWTCVVFSIAFSESSQQQRILEPAASSIESRFRAMQKLKEAGIYTGTAMMPIMPFLNDTENNLRAIVAQTSKHGGQFVLAGGMVLGDGLEKQLFSFLQQIDATLPVRYQQLYQGGFSPRDHSWSQLGRKVRELCNEHGLAHRIQRYIAPGPLAINKEIAEKLFLKVYEMELLTLQQRKSRR